MILDKIKRLLRRRVPGGVLYVALLISCAVYLINFLCTGYKDSSILFVGTILQTVVISVLVGAYQLPRCKTCNKHLSCFEYSEIVSVGCEEVVVHDDAYRCIGCDSLVLSNEYNDKIIQAISDSD